MNTEAAVQEGTTQATKRNKLAGRTRPTSWKRTISVYKSNSGRASPPNSNTLDSTLGKKIIYLQESKEEQSGRKSLTKRTATHIKGIVSGTWENKSKLNLSTVTGIVYTTTREVTIVKKTTSSFIQTTTD